MKCSLVNDGPVTKMEEVHLQTDEQIKFFETAYNPRFSLLRFSSCFF